MSCETKNVKRFTMPSALAVLFAFFTLMFFGSSPAFAMEVTLDADSTGTTCAYRMLAGGPDELSFVKNPNYDEASLPSAFWKEIGVDTSTNTAPGALTTVKNMLEQSPTQAAYKIGDAADALGNPKDMVAGQTVSLPAGYYVFTTSYRPIPTITYIPAEGAMTLIPKPISIPGLEKHVKQSDGTWGKTTFFTTGELVAYKLSATMPASYGNFEEYSLKFVDTQPEGSHLSSNVPVKVTCGDVDITELAQTAYDETTRTLTVSIADTKKSEAVQADSVVEVTYSCFFDETASCGSTSPNVNEAYLVYSTGNPKKPTDETEKDKTSSITFRLNILKVDSDDSDKPLAKATFVLADSDGLYYVLGGGWTSDKDKATRFETDDEGKTSISGLGPGKYALDEIAAPEGYSVPEKPFELTVAASFEEAGKVSLSAEITDPAKLTSVSAQTGDMDVLLKNSKEETPPGTNPPGDNDNNAPFGSIPKMGEGIGYIVVILAALGILVGVLVTTRKHKNEGDGEDGQN